MDSPLEPAWGVWPPWHLDLVSRINLSHLRHQVRGDLFWQPWKTNTVGQLNLGMNLSVEGKVWSHKEVNNLPIRWRSPSNSRIWITDVEVYPQVSTDDEGEGRRKKGLGKYTGPEQAVLERHPFGGWGGHLGNPRWGEGKHKRGWPSETYQSEAGPEEAWPCKGASQESLITAPGGGALEKRGKPSKPPPCPTLYPSPPANSCLGKSNMLKYEH